MPGNGVPFRVTAGRRSAAGAEEGRPAAKRISDSRSAILAVEVNRLPGFDVGGRRMVFGPGIRAPRNGPGEIRS